MTIPSLLRELQAVIIEILTNKGEIKKYRFENRDQAIEFLERFSVEDEFKNDSLLTIYDIPIVE